MGHRALVAYRQADWTYTVRYAHWGAGLATAITPETPLGGPANPPDTAALADRVGVDPRGGYDPAVTTRVDPRPIDTGAAADDVLGAVEPTDESLVVVSPSYDATAYLVCSLDPTTTGTDPVFADPDDDPDDLRAWFVETKSRLSAAVANDTLSPETARATLRRSLAGRATLYPPDDASFLRDR